LASAGAVSALEPRRKVICGNMFVKEHAGAATTNAHLLISVVPGSSEDAGDCYYLVRRWCSQKLMAVSSDNPCYASTVRSRMERDRSLRTGRPYFDYWLWDTDVVGYPTASAQLYVMQSPEATCRDSTCEGFRRAQTAVHIWCGRPWVFSSPGRYLDLNRKICGWIYSSYLRLLGGHLSGRLFDGLQ